jgi:hypothetical protein
MLRRLFFMFTAVGLTTTLAFGDIYTPTTNEPPAGQPGFGWSRSDANAFYSGWDTFSDSDLGTPGVQDSTPDVAGSKGAGGVASGLASLRENSGSAFVTGGGNGNIYSFSGATDFTVTIPTLGPGAFNTTIVAQFKTLGTILDYSSIKLNGVAASLGNTFKSLDNTLGGMGGSEVNYLAKWDLAAVTGPLTLTFAASGSSMSLDQLHIDGFSSAVAAVPEPSSMLFMAAAVGGAGYRQWRKRKTLKAA